VTADGPPKGDDFARQRYAWLQQVREDHSLPPSACKLAVALLKFYSRTERCARPGVERLAAEMGASVRTIQRLLQKMTLRHLTIEIGGGRGGANAYRWIIRPAGQSEIFQNSRLDAPASNTPTLVSPIGGEKLRQERQGFERETPTDLTRKGDSSDQETLTQASPEPLEVNLLKEPKHESSSVVPFQPRESAPPSVAPDDDEVSQLNLRKIFGDMATPRAIREAPSVIRRWIAEGFDLRADIVPFLEDLARKLKNPLIDLGARTFCQDLAARREDRLSRPAAPALGAKARIEVQRDSPAGRACEKRFIAEQGKKPPWRVPHGRREESWGFPVDWPEIRAGPGAEP
jgi:hypothetical protein